MTFESPPLERGLELLGGPVLELEVATDRPVAMIAVRLSDVAPDDRATRVTYGLLNLCHRHRRRRPEYLVPGEPVRVRLKLNDLAQSFPAGHRLRLGISTSYWPQAWPPPEPVQLTVYPTRSTLILPARPPQAEDAGLRPFGPPEGAEPSHRTILEAEDKSWIVTRDLTREETTLHITDDDGVYHLGNIDLTVEKRAEEWYRYRESDFDSVEGEVKSVRGLSRGDWHARTESRTIMSSTPQALQLHATLDAFEGKRRIFTRIWNESVPRRYL